MIEYKEQGCTLYDFRECQGRGEDHPYTVWFGLKGFNGVYTRIYREYDLPIPAALWLLELGGTGITGSQAIDKPEKKIKGKPLKVGFN